MEYNIYIDESGNTGNIEVNEDFTWNFKNQTHFALGALYFNREINEELEDEIRKHLHKFDSKLGDEHELKSKAKYVFRDELIVDLTNLLCANNVKLYFDIADKKFKTIMNIVEYCVYPYYLYDEISTRNQRVNIANFLYNHLLIESIKMFIDLCQETNKDENTTINRMLEFLLNLRDLLKKNKHQDYNKVNCVIDVIQNYEELHLSFENILPVKDYNNKGTKESFLPNVDAFNSLLGHINLKIKCSDGIYVYHDKQNQFSNVLSKWSESLNEYGTGIKQLEFCESKESVLIQVADFYTGNILRLYKYIISKPYLDRKTRELLKQIKPLLYECNIVASNHEQQRFFDYCNIKYDKTPLSFH